MDWAWVTSLDQLWRSPTFPMWLTLAAAVFFAIIVLLTLLRAEKTVANGVLTIITLLAIGIAGAVTIRGFGPDSSEAFGSKSLPAPGVNVAMPALSCIDGLAGDVVEIACEKALFGSPDAVAAAVSYVASEISRLRAFGDVSDSAMSPELQALRRAIERDRYGLVAHVLVARDHCQPSNCAAFRLLTNHSQVAANMEEQIYEKLVLRYAASWNAPDATATTDGAVPGLPPTSAFVSEPTGKPTTAEFPTAASIPPVNIMTPEPPTGAAPPSPPPPAVAQTVPKPRPAAARKPHAPKPHPVAPVRLTPEPSSAGAQN
jgi:hypothetical protein